MATHKSVVYLIPSLLSETATDVFGKSTLDAIKKCEVFFVENLRTARRFIKSVIPDFVIDHCEWIDMQNENDEVQKLFLEKITADKIVGIISEAGCPGVADPGQKLIALAHRQNVLVKPLIGASSILLALMASGMNGQHFMFEGYLPIEKNQLEQKIKTLEKYSLQNNCTIIFIETPYRNNRLIETLIKICQSQTLLCIASNITAENEWVKTKTILEWKKNIPDLHKQPCVFLVGGD